MPTPSRNAIYDATIRRMTACALEEAENRFAVEHAQDTEQQLADYLRKYADELATGDSGRRDHSDTLRKLGGGCGGGGAAFPRASEPAGQVPARPGRDPAPASHLPPEESRKTGAGEGTNEGAGRKKKKKSSIRYYLIRVTPLRESVIYWETLNQSSAAEQRVFCPHAAG